MKKVIKSTDMKILYAALLLFVSALTLNAQEADKFAKTDARTGEAVIPGKMDFVPGEILIKFRDGVSITPEALLAGSSLSKGVNSTLGNYKVTRAEKLFPLAKTRKSLQVVRTPQGTEMVIPNLSNIFRIVLPAESQAKGLPVNLMEVIEELKQSPEVEYAEPNYYYSIGSFKPESPEMSLVEAKNWTNENYSLKGQTGLLPNDPLYGSQWGIPAIKADEVWNTHTGDTTSIIAILDTGVDLLHPDLVENIWTNPNEIPGNGKDDDGNGYIDDVYGWDFINNDNDPKDDNSHGTHCAGIAAATGDNGIGIAGVNWKARIMAVKVFQSSGWADAATIAKGINYAAQKGATVISMSFGGYGESYTTRSALANAYATAVLVAAAGNDGLCIGPGRCPDMRPGQPLFPGAYSFVLGVEAPPSPPNGFTNYDQDGPVFSAYQDQLNYELKAPGTGILSCVPGGNYRSYSGTSMAAPMVAGAVSLYRELKSSDSQELMWGNFINTLSAYIDVKSAVTVIPKPVLNVIRYSVSDTLAGGGGDRDMKADAGETIQLEIFARNSWGPSDSIFVGVEFAEFEDQSTAAILQSETMIGSIGAYSNLSNFIDPLEIKINSIVAHGREIKFILKTWKGKQHLSESLSPLNIRVEHGTELIGVLEDTLILTPDKFWLVSNSFKIGTDGILIIKPGTTIKIEKRVINYGKILAAGTKDSTIQIIGPEGITSGRELKFEHTNFTGIGVILGNGASSYESCRFENISNISSISDNYSGLGISARNCLFKNINFKTWGFPSTLIFSQTSNLLIEKSNFYNIDGGGVYTIATNGKITGCNFSGFNDNSFYALPTSSEFSNNNILTNAKYFYSVISGISLNLPNVYWGTTDSVKISKVIVDFWDDAGRSLLKYKPLLIKPNPLAHGCVWKVVVNGFDAQDEFKILDPLGIGRHKFEVYFNRPMDVKYPPTVTMGVRYPYNQMSINENGSWSPDSLIYTVYKTLGLTQADGINRIQVTEGKDTEGFDLVPENERFNVNIQSQGSLSTDFMATPGMGKVSLEWSSPEKEVSDLLGYNMYRYSYINDSVTTDTLLVSKSLLSDTLYTDYTVVPATRYFYTYKTVKTDFSESAFSKVVAATPFTAAKGDANGDLAVNVSDIITTVSYILVKNPAPFIFEAADINSDGTINVLDVTGIVSRILNPAKSGIQNNSDVTATLFFRNDTVFISTEVPIAGIQFTLHNLTADGYTLLPGVDGFEKAVNFNADSLLFIAYSMSGKTTGPGVVPVLKLKSKSTWLDRLVLSDPSGKSITGIITKDASPAANVNRLGGLFELGQNFPNPVSGETTITFRLQRAVDEAVFTIIDSQGREIDQLRIEQPSEGENHFTWRPRTARGIYLGKLSVRLSGTYSSEKSIKMIIK